MVLVVDFPCATIRARLRVESSAVAIERDSFAVPLRAFFFSFCSFFSFASQRGAVFAEKRAFDVRLRRFRSSPSSPKFPNRKDSEAHVHGRLTPLSAPRNSSALARTTFLKFIRPTPKVN